ncbi:hypothetical protein [Burkholderia multivorans]|uniref:hypothetical protein n=1 Tax=Burkholderia multivorans TaxID=87883 RepID=UPI001589971F|nr:hypothetical protein [Burkholderia multivorans]MBY4672310.1 hypothetical protein [Burkholderia multivorans]
MAHSIEPRPISRLFSVPRALVKKLRDVIAGLACEKLNVEGQRVLASENVAHLDALLGVRVQFDTWLEAELRNLRVASLAGTSLYVPGLLRRFEEAKTRNAKEIVMLAYTTYVPTGDWVLEAIRSEWADLQTFVCRPCDAACINRTVSFYQG